MSNAVRAFVCAPFLGLCLALAAPVAAHAEDGTTTQAASPFTISATATLVSDYRFRGVSQTGGKAAVQGSVNINHESGLYAGVWASNVDFGKFGRDTDALFGKVEIDVYGGWTGEVAPGLTADAGLLYYFYPDGEFAMQKVFEPYASLSTTLGPARVKVGTTYGWKQATLGGIDNLQVYTNVDVGIPSTPLTASAHLGYIDGASAAPWQAGTGDRTGFDYSLGLSASLHGMTLGVSYIGTEGPNIDGISDDAVMGSLSYSF
jgi:uncharacterized protein (TIGR02001 family)